MSLVENSRRRGAIGVALLLCLFAWGPGADAAKSDRACAKACAAGRRTCLADLRAAVRGSANACKASGGERSACKRERTRLTKAGKLACRSARQRCKACCAAAGTTCHVAPEPPIFSGPFPVPDRAALSTPPLPPGPGGQGFTLLALPDGLYFYDPALRTPVSAAAECAAVMLACFDRDLRNWAGCFANVPTCATDTPWEGNDPMCCAAACGERYQTLRASGRTPGGAFAGAIYEDPSCMPGVLGHAPEAQVR